MRAAADPVRPWRRLRIAAGAHRATPIAPYLVVAVVAIWATRSYWWPGTYVVTFDGYAYSGPNTAVTEAAFRRGDLPLWNDSIFGGVTHLGNPQAGALYPPRLLTLLWEDNRAMGVLVALHVALLGVGMVALGRRLGLVRPAAAFAGCAAVLSGAVLTRSIQFEQILVVAWLPLLLTVIHATLTSNRLRWAVAATALTTAAMLVSGHPQIVFESIVVAVAATIGFTIGGSRWRRLPHLAAGVGLGALIAAPQLVAAAIATSQSAVAGGRDEQSLFDPALSLVPGASARALLGVLGDRHPVTFVGGFESIAFIGVITAVLAVVGAVDAVGRRDRRAWAVAFLVCAALSLLWSFGPRTVVFRLASDVIPGFDLARGSARWLSVVTMLAIVFAAAGVDALLCRRGRHSLVVGVVAALVGGATIAARGLAGSSDVAVQWVTLAVIAIVGIGAAVRLAPRWGRIASAAVATLAILELGLMSLSSLPQQLATDVPFTSPSYHLATTDWLRGRVGFTISLSDDPREAAYGVPGLRPNANVLSGIRSIDGYDGGVQVTERWAAALRRLVPQPDDDLPLRNNLAVPLDTVQLGRLGVRYVLIDRTRPIADLVPDWEGPRVTDELFEVWENPRWVGEALAWSSAEVVDPDRAPDELRTRADELSRTALVDRLDEPLTCAAPTAQCAPTALSVDHRTPERIDIVADSPRRTIVTLDQQFEPGWHVTVDGRPGDVLEVDGLVVGVDVPPGRHEISWRYRPDWLTPTLVVAGLALLAVGVIALGPPSAAAARRWTGRTDRRRTPPPVPAPPPTDAVATADRRSADG